MYEMVCKKGGGARRRVFAVPEKPVVWSKCPTTTTQAKVKRVTDTVKFCYFFWSANR